MEGLSSFIREKSSNAISRVLSSMLLFCPIPFPYDKYKVLNYLYSPAFP
jgi:hypothetical protein